MKKQNMIERVFNDNGILIGHKLKMFNIPKNNILPQKSFTVDYKKGLYLFNKELKGKNKKS